jgi:hypothetical protein
MRGLTLAFLVFVSAPACAAGGHAAPAGHPASPAAMNAYVSHANRVPSPDAMNAYTAKPNPNPSPDAMNAYAARQGTGTTASKPAQDAHPK